MPIVILSATISSTADVLVDIPEETEPLDFLSDLNRGMHQPLLDLIAKKAAANISPICDIDVYEAEIFTGAVDAHVVSAKLENDTLTILEA